MVEWRMFKSWLVFQVVKNLVYLGRLSEALDRNDDLVWLAKKFVREANHEVIHNVKVTVKVNFSFSTTSQP